MHPRRLQAPKHITTITYLYGVLSILVLIPTVPQTCKAAPPSKSENAIQQQAKWPLRECKPKSALYNRNWKAAFQQGDHGRRLPADSRQYRYELVAFGFIHCAPNNRLARLLTAIWSKRLGNRLAKCRGESGCMRFCG
ncbi:uncharacterized protein TrAFT101_011704 [Trichoderma asperellum]|uniref:uncharacterized protein n=1 Tax=Trichoderma asperellum TaxID=101201 RepID=UPI00333085D0|nr:hypothetical protein TrAFT101_011704 [Trichoderma asperellum]